MGSVHIDAKIRADMKPMPPGFDPPIVQHQGYIRWAATVPTPTGPMKLELGFSTNNGRANVQDLATTLRHEIWTVLELARLGHHQMLGHADVNRHDRRRRPVSAPLVRTTHDGKIVPTDEQVAANEAAFQARHGNVSRETILTEDANTAKPVDSQPATETHEQPN